MALSLPPLRATILRELAGRDVPGTLEHQVLEEMRQPGLPGGLSAVPTRYQTQWATTGAR